MAYKLNPTRPPGTELSRALGNRLKKAIRTSGSKREPIEKRIHTARTSCKKARATLKLLRSQKETLYRRENTALATAARALSGLRDADALLATFDATLKHFAVAADQFRAARAALVADRRATTPDRRGQERQMQAFVRDMRKIAKRLGAWKPAADFDEVASDLGDTYRRARRALREVKSKPTGSGFHEWRKATKAFYYQCRLLRAAWPPVMKEVSEELGRLSEYLGDEHDLTVLRDRIRRLDRKGQLAIDDKTRTAILGLIATRRGELRAEAIPLGERIFADTRRATVARTVRWWKAAQAKPSQNAAA